MLSIERKKKMKKEHVHISIETSELSELYYRYSCSRIKVLSYNLRSTLQVK